MCTVQKKISINIYIIKIQKLSISLIALLFIANIYSQNLIRNGGLETGNLNPWVAWNPSGIASISKGNAHTGSYAVQLSNNECSIEQVVSGLKPNTQYELSGWCKLASQQNSVGIGAKHFGGT